MEEKTINARLDALENKIDLLLEYVNQQRLRNNTIEDLAGDLSIIGKDLYDTTVEELDKRQVEIDPDHVTDLVISLMRNIDNFKVVMNTFEMAIDLTKELGPIANETILDLTKKLANMEEKGYFELVKVIGPVIDNMVSELKPEDMKNLADSMTMIVNIIKDLTQPKVLQSIDGAIKAFVNLNPDEVPSYSLWKTMKEMNSPEVKKALGFGIILLKEIAKNNQK